MKKNKQAQIEHDIEKTIDSILSRKIKGVERTLNSMILDSLNKLHSKRIDEFSNNVLPDLSEPFGTSVAQKFGHFASTIHKSILKDL